MFISPVQWGGERWAYVHISTARLAHQRFSDCIVYFLPQMFSEIYFCGIKFISSPPYYYALPKTKEPQSP